MAAISPIAVFVGHSGTLSYPSLDWSRYVFPQAFMKTMSLDVSVSSLISCRLVVKFLAVAELKLKLSISTVTVHNSMGWNKFITSFPLFLL